MLDLLLKQDIQRLEQKIAFSAMFEELSFGLVPRDIVDNIFIVFLILLI